MNTRTRSARRCAATGGPVNLSRFPTGNWITSKEDYWEFGAAFTDVPHFQVLMPARTRCPVPPESMELDADDIRQFERRNH